MNCRNCKHWVLTRCRVTGIIISADMLCNAWELSRVAELEAFIDRLVEAGDAMSNAQSMWVAEEDKWDALVKDWKER